MTHGVIRWTTSHPLPWRPDLVSGYHEGMDVNPYESPKAASNREGVGELGPNLLRLAWLSVIAAVIAFALIQVWIATAPFR